jgi:hypothetical protein
MLVDFSSLKYDKYIIMIRSFDKFIMLSIGIFSDEEGNGNNEDLSDN